ncbi:MAG: aminoacyl--tRNA ligase-related protein [Halolamina sp.]|uniref:aminoacyl--tRNA ligase-related protein n=1 Tax=Halolamina sp. TaxID=1940283 RepID=UPI002FC32634
MRRSDLFLPASRQRRGEGTEATELLVRAGLVGKFDSGLWALTPTGERIQENVIQHIQAEMGSVGGQEVTLPGLQHRERWEESGRWQSFGGEMFTLADRGGRELCLAPSHEEGIVHLLDGLVRSYEELPLTLYQVDSKFRDDHPRGGLLRCKEFTTKDAYSFHADEASLREGYRKIRAAYERLLADLDMKFAVAESANSVMDGERSEEVVAPVAGGTCALLHCEAVDCRFGLTDESGRPHEVWMGSYGLGVGGIIQTPVMQGGAEGGVDADSADAACHWPVTDWGCVAPYRAAVIPIGDGEVQDVAEAIHDDFGRDCLLFDSERQSVGERFAESELLGIPAKIIVGNGYRETGQVEIETRDGESRAVAVDEVASAVDRFGAGG